MKRGYVRFACLALSSCAALTVLGELINVAEDDATPYGGSWNNGSNSGSGFGQWTLKSEGSGESRHAGFYIATTDNNKDLNGIVKDGKAFGLFANGVGFEQAVAYRAFARPLAVGDSFSFMIENGRFEKKFDKDESGGGSVGLVLRTGNASSSATDYNSGAMFEFGYYQGSSNFRVHDGSLSSDSGIPFTDSGLTVTITVTGADTYDLEVQTMNDKNLKKLPGRKFRTSGSVESMAIFNRNSEKHDLYVNQFQVCREAY